MKLSAPTLLLSAAMCLSGCADDLMKQREGIQEVLVPVTFNLTIKDMQGTRSLAPGYKYADGKSISILKCYVYSQSGGSTAAPSNVFDIDVKMVSENKGGDVTLLLPKGETYDVVFLGTSIPQTDSATKLYYDTTARTLNLNYSLINCNDEEIDCFFASRENVTTETAFNQTIELSRPLAQLNIGTQDYADYNASTSVKNISVSVDGVYSSIDLMTGDVVGNPVKADFKASAVPTGQTFPASGYSFLSMNYVLVNLRKLVDVSLTVNHTNSSTAAKTIDIPGVAVERNYQSNVYGKKLLTEEITQ